MRFESCLKVRSKVLSSDNHDLGQVHDAVAQCLASTGETHYVSWRRCLMVAVKLVVVFVGGDENDRNNVLDDDGNGDDQGSVGSDDNDSGGENNGDDVETDDK